MILPFPPGRVIDDRYRTTDVVGRGGHGAVYRATQLSTGQDVAVKVLLTEPGADKSRVQRLRARFQREMESIARLRHPNIVRLIDGGVLPEGNLYTVLELVEGITLIEALEHEQTLDPAEAQHLMSQVLDALSSAHSAGIVHRDLKPGNIMLTRTGARRNAMVLDFGIAGILSHARTDEYTQLTKTGVSVGTTAYMAPEQIRGEPLTPQTDLYAWGLVLLECLAGSQAIRRPTQKELLTLHLSPKPVPIPASVTDAPLRAIVGKALGKRLNERYTTADEAMRELARYRPAARLEQTTDLDSAAIVALARAADLRQQELAQTAKVNMLSNLVMDGAAFGGLGDPEDDEATVVAPPSMLPQDPFANLPDVSPSTSLDLPVLPEEPPRQGWAGAEDGRPRSGERPSHARVDDEEARRERARHSNRARRQQPHHDRAKRTRLWVALALVVGIGLAVLIGVVLGSLMKG